MDFQTRIENAKFGFHRSYVVNNQDPNNYGQVLVFIPDTMTTTQNPPTTGIWAMPANLDFGGTNTNITDQGTLNSGSSKIPVVGTWWWIFFENGNINRPFYFAPVSIQNKIIMTENTQGSEPWNKWVLLRSPLGKEIVVSDDPSDSQILLTGSKKDPSNFLEVANNQSVISINDSNSNDMILLQDYNSNFIKISTAQNEITISATSEVVITDGTDTISLIKNNKQITVTNSQATISILGPDIKLSTTQGNILAENNGMIINMDSSNKTINAFSPQDINLNAVRNVNINGGVQISQNGGGIQNVTNLSSTTSVPMSQSLQNINDTVSNMRGSIMSAASGISPTQFTQLQGIVNGASSNLQNSNTTAMTNMNNAIANNSTAALTNISSASDNNSITSAANSALNNMNNDTNSAITSINNNTTSVTNTLQQQINDFITTNNINGTSALLIQSAVSNSIANINSVTINTNTTMSSNVGSLTTSSVDSLTNIFIMPNSTGLVSPTLSPTLTSL